MPFCTIQLPPCPVVTTPSGARDCRNYDTSLVGDSGPISISYTKAHGDSHLLWHKTLNTLGIETNKRHLGGSNVGAWTSVNANDPTTVTRSYAIAYLGGEVAKHNLHVLTGALVESIVLRDKQGRWTATGVRFFYESRPHIVSVDREVILSAGAVQSPQILELSGIGRSDILSAAGIEVKVESPRVGENLQDHLGQCSSTLV